MSEKKIKAETGALVGVKILGKRGADQTGDGVKIVGGGGKAKDEITVIDKHPEKS